MKYFSFSEFERSETASKRGIDNTIPASLKGNIEALVDNILDPLREAWGRPIIVTSGYRSPALNKAVGGVATSQHQQGQAADITAGSPVDNARLFQLVQTLKLPFDQMINESDFSWLHISYSPRHRRQTLKL